MSRRNSHSRGPSSPSISIPVNSPRAVHDAARMMATMRGSIFAAGSSAPPQQQAGMREVLAQVQTRMDEIEAGSTESLREFQRGIQASIDDLAIKMAAHNMQAGTSPQRIADPEYTGLFASYARGGLSSSELLRLNNEGARGQVNAAMSTTAPGEQGGYLAPVEWDRGVSKALLPISPMRRMCQVVETKVRAYSTVWNLTGWGSGWVGETAVRPETTSATLKQIVLGHGEIYAMPSVTQGLLDDADFPMDEWLSSELAETFATQENITFIAGDGVNKPFGVLTYVTGQANAAAHPGGAILTVPTGNASTLPDSTPLIDLVYKLGAPYRQGAAWLMNSQTAATISKIRDAGGNFIWRYSLEAGQPSELLGYPVEFDENMPSIQAGALPILFGNFKKGYVINDRFGLRILRDPYTNKPYVMFYATKRVGGGLLDPNAFKALRVAAS